MKRIIRVLLVLIASSTAILYSCKHEVVVPTSPVMSYKSDIQAIFIANCTQSGCHVSGNGHDDKVFPLSTYDEVMEHDRIIPGDANNSQTYTAITTGKMPKAPYAAMPDQQVLKLYLWIMQGAKNN